MLLGGEKAVFVGRRLHLCQKRSCETLYRGTSSHSTLEEFGFIGKWPWTQFPSRACAVSWLTEALLLLFPWSIVRNARRRSFEHMYLGRMAQMRCHFGCTILSFWFDSSRCLSVSLLRPDCSVLQANWRGSESEADFHFLWPTAWSRWRLFLWLCILLSLLVSPQLRQHGSCPIRPLDRASQCTLCGRVALIGLMGADMTLDGIF